MIELARLVDAEARALAQSLPRRKTKSNSRRTPPSPARGTRMLGTAGYPDATFTLRLAFGAVKGYEEDGAAVPAVHHLWLAFTNARRK